MGQIHQPELQRINLESGRDFVDVYLPGEVVRRATQRPIGTGTQGTGLRPSTSGVYGNRSDWRRALPDRKTLMQRFMDAEYVVRGAGKIFHHHLDGAFHDKASFHDFQPMRPQTYPPKKLNGASAYGSRNTDWGVWPERIEDSIDFRTASYVVDELGKPAGEKPRFLACGIFKPHSPFFAPGAYHEAYRGIGLPERREDDWSDLPRGAVDLMKNTKWFWRGMTKVDKSSPGASAPRGSS